MTKLINVILLVLLIPLTHLSHLFLNNLYSDTKYKVEEKFNLPSPEITKVASIGYDNFLADLLWLQLIQYFGNTKGFNVILPELYSLINNIITLDPKFIDGYIFGAYALVDNKEFDKAVDILERGVKSNPNEWYLPYQLGFMYYIYKKNKVVAARYLDKAGSVSKESPVFLKKLAATLYTDSGNDFEIKTQLWQSVYDKAKQEGDQVNMEKAYKKLTDLKIENDLETLRRAINKYQEKTKQKPADTVFPDAKASPSGMTDKQDIPKVTKPLPPLTELRDLVENGFIKKVPLDPFKRPYIFNEKTKEVQALPQPLEHNK